MSKNDFSKAQRLLKKKNFDEVFAANAKRHSRFFSARTLKTDNPARLGIVVPKKTIAQACQRNRLKRLVREAFRLNQARLLGFDVVILANRHANRQKKSLLRTDIDTLLNVIARNPSGSNSRPIE